MKNILTLYDLTKEELENLIDRSVEIFHQINQKNLKPKRDLKGKISLIYFEKPSTRTRISFDSAIRRLGGEVIFVSPSETQISRGEDKRDFIKVVSGYIDLIIARVYDHRTLETFAENIEKPIINALSDLSHPTQIISDLATIKLLTGDYINKRICFLGDAKNNVARSWIEAQKVLGTFELIFSTPNGLEPEEKGNYKLETDPVKALIDSDILYLDVWFSMGQEHDEEKYKKLLPYALDDSKLSLLSGKFVFHCLPAKKGEEISHKIFSMHENTIYTQAHMKLPSAISIIENLDIS
ncbi:MAG: hypothetical protein NZ927_03725 [Candidatus Calescibacterium sp.]|nr:hypothetical protein [Candidatus Calescibacterium sp.]MCX7733509.1 hypothetical protein [bacterium]MDW8087222.1 hypothetical protein [Candidatus Calescibacterium sp.]